MQNHRVTLLHCFLIVVGATKDSSILCTSHANGGVATIKMDIRADNDKSFHYKIQHYRIRTDNQKKSNTQQLSMSKCEIFISALLRIIQLSVFFRCNALMLFENADKSALRRKAQRKRNFKI